MPASNFGAEDDEAVSVRGTGSWTNNGDGDADLLSGTTINHDPLIFQATDSEPTEDILQSIHHEQYSAPSYPSPRASYAVFTPYFVPPSHHERSLGAQRSSGPPPLPRCQSDLIAYHQHAPISWRPTGADPSWTVPSHHDSQPEYSTPDQTGNLTNASADSGYNSLPRSVMQELDSSFQHYIQSEPCVPPASVRTTDPALSTILDRTPSATQGLDKRIPCLHAAPESAPLWQILAAQGPVHAVAHEARQDRVGATEIGDQQDPWTPGSWTQPGTADLRTLAPAMLRQASRGQSSTISRRSRRSKSEIVGTWTEYQCDRCLKYFLEAKHLSHHKSKEHGTTKYSCETCPKSFKEQRDLNRHRKEIHDKLPNAVFCPNHGCKFATKGFKRQEHFSRHVQKCQRVNIVQGQ